MNTEQFRFFWKGKLSQWHRSNFTVGGKVFNCSEQFMMFGKASFFDDYESAEKIMLSSDPREQKALGRKVKGFDIDRWSDVARRIVYAGNVARFSQNKELFDLLMKTGDATLVEASPYDIIWGIGLSADDKRAQNRATWNGRNWLGETLTRVREDIKNSNISQHDIDFASDLVDKYQEYQFNRWK